MAYIVMAYIIMAYIVIVMVYIGMAYIVMAYTHLHDPKDGDRPAGQVVLYPYI